ncbi:MAG: hypothetical protein U0412_13270 [Nitrospira sp.]
MDSLLPRRSIGLVFAVGLLTACAGTPEFDAPIGNSAIGSVFLERVPDRSFQAAHPTKLDSSTLRTALDNVLVEDTHLSLSTLLSQKSQPVRAFTEAETAFLAPLLSEGLRQAAPDQQVGFTVLHTHVLFPDRDVVGAGVGSNAAAVPVATREESAGAVFVHGRSLHLEIRRLHIRPDRPDAVNMPNRRLPDRTGLTDHALSFAVPAARRPASYVIRGDADQTLVLDYEYLAAVPGPAVLPAPTATNPASATGMPTTPVSGKPDEVRTLQEQMRQKDREMENLRKELQDIRQQLQKQPPNSSPDRSR